MTKIKIPFNEWSKDKLRKGIKICTSRSQKYGEVGDTFEVEGKEYVLIGFARLSYEQIINALWQPEGAESTQELGKVLREIHPNIDFTASAWVHFFSPHKVSNEGNYGKTNKYYG